MALWRETLLAQAVLRGETRGYRNHPQLARFKNHPTPLVAISVYLQAVHQEAVARRYTFDKSKFQPTKKSAILIVTSGQLEFEWAHLMAKLKARNYVLYEKWQKTIAPEPHPMFEVHPGEIESWERS